LAGCSEEESFWFTLLFEEPSGLQQGDPVVYKDTVIGHVKAVMLKKRPEGVGGIGHVTVGIRQQYRELLYHQMDYTIKGREVFGKDKQILVQDTRQPRNFTPRAVAPGEYVMGSKGFLQGALGTTLRLVQNIENYFTQVKGETREGMQRMFQAFEQEMSRQDIDALIGRLEKQAENAADNIAEQIKELIARLKSK
jgi:ABC-type transporter Mla subunit MlaD